jgi:predicted nuclease of predicted toxin-antitoxin system
MAGRHKKSKKHCDANSAAPQPEEPTFFIDRALGDKFIAGILSKEGWQVKVHSKHFKDDAPDAEWLTEVGKQGWVVLTKDKRIKTRELERNALINAKVAAFILTSGNLKGEQMAQIFVKAKRQMLKFLSKYPKPFIATVTESGEVKLIWPKS